MEIPEDWYLVSEECALHIDGVCTIADVDCDGNESKCQLVTRR